MIVPSNCSTAAEYECHGHMFLGEGSLEDKFRMNAQYGVCAFRDGGAAEGKYLKVCPAGIKEAIDKARRTADFFGVGFRTPVYALYKEGRYGKFLGKDFSDLKEFYRLVLDVKALGADHIKVMYSGIASFTEIGALSCEPLSAAEIREIVNIVHGEGLSVMAHCNGADTIKYAIEAGTDTIEHGIFMDEEGVSMLAQSPCIWVPTVVAVACEPIQKAHIETVKKAAAAGAVIACGSDCGCSTVKTGLGHRLEAQLLQGCGLSEDKIKENSKKLMSI